MVVILAAAIFIGVLGYQIDKPCDDQCFKEKIEQETKKLEEQNKRKR